MRIQVQVAIALLVLYGLAAWQRPTSSNARAAARATADPRPTVGGAPELPAQAAQARLERAKPLSPVQSDPQLRTPPAARGAELLAPQVGYAEGAYAPKAEPVPESQPTLDVALNRLQERWQSEHDDPEWSENERATAKALFDLFELPEELLLDVSCRITVCRIAVDAGDITRFAGLAEHLHDEQYPIAFTLGDDPPGQAIAYLPRAGFEQDLLDLAATQRPGPTPGK